MLIAYFSIKGFGGKFGVQTDRKDKSALSYDEEQDKIGTNYERTRPVVPVKNAGNLRARFENMAKQKEEEDKRKAEEERKKREEKGNETSKKWTNVCKNQCTLRKLSYLAPKTGGELSKLGHFHISRSIFKV